MDELDVAARNAAESGERLAALRAELARRGLNGFFIPRADEYQGEYVPPHAQRLAWLTGFTGSAGAAVVLDDRAAIFVDGRYTLQVRQEVDDSLFTPLHLIEHPPTRFLAETVTSGQRIGYDPWLHTIDGVERLRLACSRVGAHLIACDDNPLDAAWPDQPPPPTAPILPHDIRFAGRSSLDKRTEIAGLLAEDKLDAVVLSAPDSVAWLLNVRGGDVAYSPLPLSFAILHRDGSVQWFVDRRKIGADLPAHLTDQISLAEPQDFGAALDGLGVAKKSVQLDFAQAPAWVFDRLQRAGADISRGADPCALPKARKNRIELDGMRACHRRDGVALTRFLAWLSETAPQGGLSEIAASDKLESLRRENDLFRDLSFPTIAGSGPHGAIVHYRAVPKSNRDLRPGELFLLDSGAQYLDGTTDVTRTMAIGPAGDDEKRHFTLVLKGHIALATARFPAGTTGSQLDTLARRPLWDEGLDYDHGTGHGVGSYLGVHEGPQRISKVGNTVALAPGMVLSNEPGYYRTDHYGIRIENLLAVIEIEATSPQQGARRFLGFETLTLAPIDLYLIDRAMLTPAEQAWLNAYHRDVRASLTPLLDAQTAAWLEQATQPI